MAAIVWTDVTGAFPELAAATTAGRIPLPLQTVWLTIANTQIAVANFDFEGGPVTNSARLLLAAHLATIGLKRGAPGAVSSQSEGGASQSYWMGFASPRMLHTTGYGQALVQLIMGTPARAGAIVN